MSEIDLPPYIDPEAWQGFVEMRLAKGKRTPFTPRAAKMILKTLEELKEAGHDANASLDQSTLAGWSDVYEPKQKSIRRATSQQTASADRWLEEHSKPAPSVPEVRRREISESLQQARLSIVRKQA